MCTPGGYTWRPSLDSLRNKLTKGLEVRVEQPEARRGEEIEALVVVAEPERLGELEVGLVCTEHYDEQVASASDSGTTRTTSKAIAHEAWQPVQAAPGEYTVRFALPRDAPFSYEGRCLSFRWAVVARARRSRGLDAQATHEISVRP